MVNVCSLRQQWEDDEEKGGGGGRGGEWGGEEEFTFQGVQKIKQSERDIKISRPNIQTHNEKIRSCKVKYGDLHRRK